MYAYYCSNFVLQSEVIYDVLNLNRPLMTLHYFMSTTSKLPSMYIPQYLFAEPFLCRLELRHLAQDCPTLCHPARPALSVTTCHPILG